MRLHSIERSLWEVAKREAREAMIAAARSPKGTMTYDELTRLITAVHFEPNSLALRELAGENSIAVATLRRKCSTKRSGARNTLLSAWISSSRPLRCLTVME